MSNDYFKGSDLYFSPQKQVQTEQGQIVESTGDPQVDDYLSRLPIEERGAALERLNAPLTGEEVFNKTRQDPTFFQRMTRDEFTRLEDFKKEQEVEILDTIGAGIDMFADTFSKALTSYADKPLESTYKLPATFIEAFLQGTRGMYGMLAYAEDPTSPFFKMKEVLTRSGSIDDRFRQYREAAQFNLESAEMFEGKRTILVNKDFINNDVAQMMAFVADPSMFIPFGGVAMKGARAVGMGEALTRAAIKAQSIKSGVLSGAIKWGVGAPLEVVGGALRDSVEWGVSKGATALEHTVGIPANEGMRFGRMAGIGTASAHIAGYSVPYAGTAATAWAGGGLAASIGEATTLVANRMAHNKGHRGILGFAGELAWETERGGLQVSKNVQTVLKVMERMDPLFSYTHDIVGGATTGAAIGGGLGYLSGGEEGAYSGLGMGLGLGAVGSALGRAAMDVSGQTAKVREGVTGTFVLRAIQEKDPETARGWASLLGYPNVDEKTVRQLTKTMIMAHTSSENFALKTFADETDYAKFLASNDVAIIRQTPTGPAVGLTAEGRISPHYFKQTDAYTIVRNSDGRVEVNVNLSKIFSPSKEFRGLTMAHEMHHVLMKHSVLGPHFQATFRDMLLGVRDQNGVLLDGPNLSFAETQLFLKKYAAARAGYRIASQEYKDAVAIIDKLAAEKVGEKTTLTQEEFVKIAEMVEEYGAYSFSLWFDSKPTEFFLRGGELTGVKGLIDMARDAWADHWENKAPMHNLMFNFHKLTKGSEFESGFIKDGKRVRVGSLDYFYRDMIRSASAIKNRGYIDLDKVSQGFLDALFAKGADEVLVKDDKTGRVRVKNRREFEQANSQKAVEIFKILESMPDADKVNGVRIGPDGNFVGMFNDAQLKAIELAGLFTPDFANRVRMFQRAEMLAMQGAPNVFTAVYLGESMGVSRTNDNQRVRGNKVAIKNREFILGKTIFEIGADGTFKMNVRVLDKRVMDMRGREVYANPEARALWRDYSDMMNDFYEVYLMNLSKEQADPSRLTTEQIMNAKYNDGTGNIRRDFLHQVAGFAKSLDLPYANKPMNIVTRGTMSAVMDLSLGRMVNVRTTGENVAYSHDNAFWDISRNFKISSDPKDWDVRDVYDESGVLVKKWTIEAVESGDKQIASIQEYWDGSKKKYKASVLFEHEESRIQDSLDGKEADGFENEGKAIEWVREASQARDLKVLNEKVFAVQRRVEEARFAQDRWTQGEDPDSESYKIQNESIENGLLKSKTFIDALSKRGISPDKNVVQQFSFAEEVAFYMQKEGDGNVAKRVAEYDKRGIPEDARPSVQQLKIAEALKYFGYEVIWDSSGRTAARIVESPRPTRSVALQSILGGKPTAIMSYQSAVVSDGLKPRRSKGGADAIRSEYDNGVHKKTHEGYAMTNVEPIRAQRRGVDDGREMIAGEAMPTVFSALALKKPTFVFLPSKGATYKKIFADAFKKGYNSIVTVSEHKAMQLLNVEFAWTQPFETASIIEVVMRPEDIDAIHAADVARNMVLYGQPEARMTRLSVGDASQSVTQLNEYGEIVPRTDDEGVVFSDKPRTLKSLATHPKRTSSGIVGRDGVDHRYLVANRNSRTNRPSSGPAFKLDTEADYLNFHLNEEIKRVSQGQGILFDIPKDDFTYLSNETTKERIWQIITDIKNRQRAFLDGLPPLRTLEEHNADGGAALAEFKRQMKELNIENRKAYWRAMAFENLEGCINEIITQPHNLINVPNKELVVYDGEEVPSLVSLYEKTSAVLMDVTDSFYEEYDTWVNYVKEFEESHPIIESAPDDMQARYYKMKGRIEAADEYIKASNIDSIKARIEAETNGILSAEIIKRPSTRVSSSEFKRLSKQGEYAGNRHNTRVMDRVTVVWGKKSIEVRDFIRSITGQRWDSNDSNFTWDGDSRNTALIERLRTDQEFRTKYESIARDYDEAVKGVKRAKDNYKTQLNDTDNSINELKKPETYADYVDAENAKRLRMLKTQFINMKDDYPEFSGSYDEIPTLEEYYNRRYIEEASVEFVEMMRQNGDFSPAIMEVINGERTMSTITRPDGHQEDFGFILPPALRNIIKDGQVKFKSEFKNLAYKDSFKPNLPKAVREILAKTPNGISARNLLKELEKLHSSGLKVKEEIKYTGFGRWLEEQFNLPKVNGKDPKVDPVEMLAFIDSTQLGVLLEDTPRINIDSHVNYHVGGKIDRYNLIAVKATRARYAPSNESQHIQDEAGRRDFTTIAHSRYTVRTTHDGKKIVYLEENQANNRASERAEAERAIGMIKAADSPASKEIVDKLIAKAIADGGVKAEFGAKDMNALLNQMELTPDWSVDVNDGKDDVIGAGSNGYISSRTRRLMSAAMQARRRSPEFVMNAGEKLYSEAIMRSVAKTMREFSRVNIEAADFGIETAGDMLVDYAANTPIDAVALMGYAVTDSLGRSNTKNKRNIKLYDFELSQQGRQTILEFYNMAKSSGLSNYETSAWLQALITASIDTDKLKPMYRRIEEVVTKNIEKYVDPSDTDEVYVRQALRASQDEDVEKIYVNGIKNAIKKTDGDAFKRNLTQLLETLNALNFATSQQTAKEISTRFSLSREDIAKIAPVFFAKYFDSALQRFNEVEHEYPRTETFRIKSSFEPSDSTWGYKVSDGASAELGDTANNVAIKIGHFVYNKKYAKYMSKYADRVLEGKFVHDNLETLTLGSERVQNQLHLTELLGVDTDDFSASSANARRLLWNEYPTTIGASNFLKTGIGYTSITQVESSKPRNLYTKIRRKAFGIEEGGSDLVDRMPTPFAYHYNDSELNGGVSPASFVSALRRLYVDQGKAHSITSNAHLSLLSYKKLAGRHFVYRAIRQNRNIGYLVNDVTSASARLADGTLPSDRFANKIVAEQDNLPFIKKIRQSYIDYMGNFTAPKDDLSRRIVAVLGKDVNNPLLSEPEKAVVDSISNFENSDAAELISILKRITPETVSQTSGEFKAKFFEKLKSVALANNVSRELMLWAAKVGLDHKKVEDLRKLADFPHIDTKEWMRLVAMAMFKRAKMEGADYLAITHPQDGGSRSNLPVAKAAVIYGELTPSAYEDVAKRFGIKSDKRSGPMHGDANDPSFAKIVEHEALYKSLEKTLFDANVGTATNGVKEPTKMKFIELKPSVQKQIADFISERRKDDQFDGDPVAKDIKEIVDHNFYKDGRSENGLHFVSPDGSASGDRTNYFSQQGFRINAENWAIAIMAKYTNRPQGTDILRDVQINTKSFDANARRFIRNTTNILDAILKVDEEVSMNPDYGQTDKIKARLADPKIQELFSKYPDVKSFVDLLISSNEAMLASRDYTEKVFNKQFEIADNRYRNAALMHRATAVFDMRDTPKFDEIRKGGMPMFKLDTGNNGYEVQVGDWNWRNSFMGDAKVSVADRARVQFIHETTSDGKVVATVRIVPKVGFEELAEDGKAVELKGYLDFATGVTTDSVTKDGDEALVDAARAEMSARMIVLGSRDYSKEALPKEYDAPLNAKFDEAPAIEDVGQPAPMFKVNTPAPAPSWGTQNVGNGTMLTRADGYIISVLNNKFRLYGANKNLIGIYSSEEEARRKADAMARKGK